MNIIVLLILFAAIIIFAPLAAIWSLNTLFATNIGYSFYTWLAVIVLSTWVFRPIQRSKKEETNDSRFQIKNR